MIQKIPQLQSFLDTSTVKWHQIQGALQKGEACVEMIRFYGYDYNRQKRTDKLTYLALILTPETKENPICVAFENGVELESMFTKYQEATNNPNELENLKKLYRLYWLPIAEKIGNAKTVYFSPSGVYHKLNLNVLVDNRGNFLIENTDIQLVASTKNLLVKSADILPIEKSIVLLGNPNLRMNKDKMEQIAKRYGFIAAYTMRGNKEDRFDNCSNLQYAEKEVKNVASFLQTKGWKTQVYVQDSAYEERLKEVGSPTVLHIASHGFYPKPYENARANQQAMLLSGLMLAGACTMQKIDTLFWHEDGVFTASEASLMNLDKTELVVLSACGTGLGLMEDGEGVYGLQKGFRTAGAKNRIISLSNVEDQHTAALIQRFYELWLSGKTIHQALRAAQIEFLNTNRQQIVGYWGSFVHIR